MSRTSFGRRGEDLTALVAAAVPPGTDVSFGPPQPSSAGLGIDVSLVRASLNAALVNSDRRHLPGNLELLVSVRCDDLVGLDLLHDVMAAIDDSEFVFAVTVPSPEWWSSNGVAPRPCVAVTAPVRIERAVERAPMVLHDITVVNDHDLPGRRIRGRVIGPMDLPVVGASVHVVASPSLTTTTDERGEFSLSGMFASDRVPIAVRHRSFAAQIDAPVDDADFLVHVSPYTSSSSSDL